MAFESPESDVRMDLGLILSAVLRRLVRIVLVTAVLCGITYALLLFVPKSYEASSSILVEPRQNAFSDSVTVRETSSVPVESTISSQIELIKSSDTLRLVIDAEKLADVAEFNGSKAASPLDPLMSLIGRGRSARSIDDTVLQSLRERLSVVRERDSAFITVLVRSEDPELAARLANSIARAHVARRAGLTLSDTTGASIWLEAEIAKMRQRVEEAERKVADFKVDNDLFLGANNTSLLDQQLSEISAQITAAQERKNTAESRAALIGGMIAAGQPIDGVPAVRESQVIQQLSQTKATLQGERAQKSATLLPNHPTIQALTAQIREIDQQIIIEGRRVADASKAEAKIEASLVASLQEELTRAKVSASGATRDTVTLDGLEREAKAQRDLLQSYLARYTEAASRSEANATLPDVRVVTEATVPTVPAAPRTAMIVGAVAFVSIVLQIGAILFGELISGRALVETARYRAAGPDEAVEPAYEPVYEPAYEPVSEAEPEEPVYAPSPVAVSDADIDAMAEFVAEIPDEPQHGVATDQWHEDPAPVREPEARPVARPEPIVAAPVAAEPVRPTPPAREVTRPAAVAAAPERTPPKAARSAPANEAKGNVDPLALSNLSADLALGRVRVILLAGLARQDEAERVAARLVDEQLKRGLSVALVDAGSAAITADLGISDLSAGEASFGDVVFKSHREGLAEVPWGQRDVIDPASGKPLTLVEALNDIYEVVIVMIGSTASHTMPSFSGLECRVVVACDHDPANGEIDRFSADSLGLGFPFPQTVGLPARHAEVA